MKKAFIAIFVLLMLVTGSIFSACSQGEVTKTTTQLSTVTVTSTLTTVIPRSTTSDVPYTATVTVTPKDSPATTITYTFRRFAPQIPHVYLLDDPRGPSVDSLISQSGGSVCFECHGVPPQHNVWYYNTDICLTCHVVSADPALVPEWPLPPDGNALS